MVWWYVIEWCILFEILLLPLGSQFLAWEDLGCFRKIEIRKYAEYYEHENICVTFLGGWHGSEIRRQNVQNDHHRQAPKILIPTKRNYRDGPPSFPISLQSVRAWIAVLLYHQWSVKSIFSELVPHLPMVNFVSDGLHPPSHWGVAHYTMQLKWDLGSPPPSEVLLSSSLSSTSSLMSQYASETLSESLCQWVSCSPTSFTNFEKLPSLSYRRRKKHQ